MTTIRELREAEKTHLKDFLYEAIFLPEGTEPPERSIVEKPELALYYENFGEGPADFCLVAEEDGKPVGAVWTRIMKDYGHIEETTPSLAIALYPQYRGRGSGTALMKALLKLLRQKGYHSVSLSVQKANPAVRMYEHTGFEVVQEREEEYLMRCDL